MNKNILLIIACLMAWVNSISAEDKIYVTDFSITAEETKEVSVQLDNTISYVAFQFDLYLPDGITLMGYEVNGNRVPESTEVSMAKMADGSIRFIAAAMSMEEITGSSGGIVTLKLKVSSEIATGNKTGSLKKVKLSKSDATGFTTAEIPYAVKVLAPITVTAKSYTRKYGEDNPSLEYDVTGDIEGVPTLSCEATATSPVGTYPIVVSKGSVTNYNDTYINGTLTITKAPLTITAQNYVIKQGEALPTFEVTYDGFKNKETKDFLAKQPTITCAATSSNVLGTYEIVVSGAETENYEITFVNGTLTIEASEEAEDNTFEEEGSAYEKKEDGSVAFAEQENPADGKCEIPETVTHDGVEYQVTAIAEGAFKDNTNLKELSIPESIVSIGDDALAGCTNLEKIHLYSDKPISIDQADASSVFSGVDTENCILYVPAGTAEVYRQAEGWKAFKNIVEMEDPDDINEINADDSTYEIYTLGGIQIETLHKGVNIIKYEKGSTKKVFVK